MKNLLVLTGLLFTTHAVAQGFSYEDIAKRFSKVAMNQQSEQVAAMQGECLVGLKQLNFRKKNVFDPIAEWSSFRTASLLEQFPPCEVLVMLEVAQSKIREFEGNSD